GPKRRVRAEPSQARVGLDECILGDVLRVVGVAGDQIRDAKGDLLVALDQQSERGGVAVPRLLGETGIRLCGLQWTALHGAFSVRARPVLHRSSTTGSD